MNGARQETQNLLSSFSVPDMFFYLVYIALEMLNSQEAQRWGCEARSTSYFKQFSLLILKKERKEHLVKAAEEYIKVKY